MFNDSGVPRATVLVVLSRQPMKRITKQMKSPKSKLALKQKPIALTKKKRKTKIYGPCLYYPDGNL